MGGGRIAVTAGNNIYKKIIFVMISFYFYFFFFRPAKLEELMNQKLNLSISTKKNTNTIIVLQRKKVKNELKIEEETINNDADSNNLIEKNKINLNSSDKLKLEMGFSSIIEFIIQSKKPIVGHYLILDILFVYESFIDDLPDDFPTFKKKVKIKIVCVIYILYYSNEWEDPMNLT